MPTTARGLLGADSRNERGNDEEESGSREQLHDFSPVPPAGTGRKGRKPPNAFVQLEVMYRLPA